jgi:hypothetical protein
MKFFDEVARQTNVGDTSEASLAMRVQTHRRFAIT